VESSLTNLFDDARSRRRRHEGPFMRRGALALRGEGIIDTLVSFGIPECEPG
jgi:hypothetical protein